MADDKIKIFIFGAGGHAKVVIDIVEKTGIYKVAFLVDDDLSLTQVSIFGYPTIGGKKALIDASSSSNLRCGIVGVGNNIVRGKISDWLVSSNFELVSIFHPSVQIARGVSIGRGTVVMASAVINSDARIGENVIINTGATVDHDCSIGNLVHVGPGSTLCGGISIGDCSLIGAGATVIPNISIGKNVIVGAGATVVSDVPDDITVVGTPAKAVRNNLTRR